MTPEQLDDIETRAEAATDGPWGDMCIGSEGFRVLARKVNQKRPNRIARVGDMDWDSDRANAEFIAQAREDVPALVAEVRRLRAIVDAVDKLHEPTGTHLVAEIDGFGGEQREIEPDSFEEITSREVVCMACAGYPEAPCATRQAIDAHERTSR